MNPNNSEPCWTGLSDSDTLCHRGGIGCPLPHYNDTDEKKYVVRVNGISWEPQKAGINYPHSHNKKKFMKTLKKIDKHFKIIRAM